MPSLVHPSFICEDSEQNKHEKEESKKVPEGKNITGHNFSKMNNSTFSLQQPQNSDYLNQKKKKKISSCTQKPPLLSLHKAFPCLLFPKRQPAQLTKPFS